MSATAPTRPDAAITRRPVGMRALWALGGIIAVVILAAASVSFGVRAVGVADILAGATGHADTLAQAAVLKRVPRTVLAALVGAALALSGAAMQAVTRNPIADPGHGHSPAAWTAVVIMLVGFALGTIFFCLELTVGVWVSVAIVVIGAISGWVLAKAGWGEKGPKYAPKAH